MNRQQQIQKLESNLDFYNLLRNNLTEIQKNSAINIPILNQEVSGYYSCW